MESDAAVIVSDEHQELRRIDLSLSALLSRKLTSLGYALPMVNALRRLRAASHVFQPAGSSVLKTCTKLRVHFGRAELSRGIGQRSLSQSSPFHV